MLMRDTNVISKAYTGCEIEIHYFNKNIELAFHMHRIMHSKLHNLVKVMS